MWRGRRCGFPRGPQFSDHVRIKWCKNMNVNDDDVVAVEKQYRDGVDADLSQAVKGWTGMLRPVYPCDINMLLAWGMNLDFPKAATSWVIVST